MSEKQTATATPCEETARAAVATEGLEAVTPGSPEAALDLARNARAGRARGQPTTILDCAVRQGGWTYTPLWWELVSLMADPADYRLVRQLWLDSPEECRNNLSLIRAVARAACIAGEHEEARLLLRRAILLAARRTQRARTLMGRGKRAVRRLVSVTKGKPLPRLNAPFDVRAAEALRDLGTATAELGIRPFLISGTLLGYVRDGAIISWDKDIDVGVFSEECPDDIEGFFNAQDNFDVRRVDLTADRLRINHKNGVWIDLFPHYLEGGLRWHDGTATRWWNKPFSLKTVDFLGCEQFVPDDPERYLEENYGRWQVPEPNFDARLDAPNAEITDQEHLDSLLYFSLLAAITKGKSRMRERYVALLRARGEGDWLSRA